MHPIIQSPRDRQLILGSGIRVQSAGYTAGGVVSQYAVRFDGNNDYITVNGEPTFDFTTEMSVSFWVYRLGSTGLWQPVVTKGSGTASGGGFFFAIDNRSSDKIEFQIASLGSTTLAKDNALAAGWNHVVGTFDGSLSGTAKLKLYVNGTEGGTYYTSGVVGNIESNNEAVHIGTQSSLTRFLFARLDEVRFYNRALTATEVASIYANIASPPTDGLVAYFPLDEGTGTTTTDEIAGLIGTLTNGPTWSTDVPAALQ